MIHLKPSQLTVLCVPRRSNRSPRSVDITHTNNEHVEELHEEIYELIQKLELYRDFLAKLTPLIEQLELLKDSRDRITKHLTSSFLNINPFPSDAQQLLDL